MFTGRDAEGRPTQMSRTVRGSKRDAQRLAAELTVAPPSRSAARTLAELLDAWLDANKPTWAESSRRDQTSRAEMVKADRIASVRLARLSVADIERWHGRLRQRGVGESSIRNQHQAVRAALTMAQRWDWVPRNVAALARLSAPKRQAREAMDLAEVQAVLVAADSIDPAAGLALRIAAVSGARRGEIAALQWSDLSDGRLTIDGSVVVERNLPGQPPTLRDGSSKTGNRRLVSIDEATIHRWSQLADERSAYGPWVFTIGENPPNPDRIGWWWTRARALSGIDLAWRLHDLRHWSATVGITSGHDVRTVAGRLGHADPSVTLRVYAHTVEAADRAVATTIGNILGEVDGKS